MRALQACWGFLGARMHALFHNIHLDPCTLPFEKVGEAISGVTDKAKGFVQEVRLIGAALAWLHLCYGYGGLSCVLKLGA